MRPVLDFKTEKMLMGTLGQEASFPDIMPGLNVQNKTVFELDEKDEIYEGYGKLDNVYPYRPYCCYDRNLQEKEIKTAVLENDFLQAVFLPRLGGRLWSLTDKKTGVNLLYTNDVVRFSNLATRNAWFSGGVEWNVGIIGHTPLTAEQLFVSELEDENGNPVLRMYEYERIRKAVYQMDFWLEENCRFLNCRMRIVNQSAEVIPMYWWSNMAVPEYSGGRILLPAGEAFTSDMSRVYKVSMPMVGGVDVTKYNQIPDQVDYFFHIPANEKKYIANLNKEGYGLIHISTDRLQSRKLFTWGHNDASRRWQEFLTENAGSYIELQAGLGKTQYGCIPMAPHTAWEWMELYGAIQADPRIVEEPFEDAIKQMNVAADNIFREMKPGRRLEQSVRMAKMPGKAVMRGSGYAELENMCRKAQGERSLADHLDFTSDDNRQEEWKLFLNTGYLICPDTEERPADFTSDDYLFEQLKSLVSEGRSRNWYAFYQLGLQYLYRKDSQKAMEYFSVSNDLAANPWSQHAMAVCLAAEGNREEAVRIMGMAVKNHLQDLSMVKECFRLFIQLDAYKELLTIHSKLPEKMRLEDRIHYNYIQALAGTGEYEKAYFLLTENGGLEIADVREGDGSIGRLWEELNEKLFGDKDKEILHKLSFSALE